MHFRLILISFIFLLFSQTARADFDFMGGIGLHEGGDDLVTVLFTDGSTETLQAGEFLELDFGVAWDMGFLEARLTGGWRYDTITGVENKVDLSRYTGTGLLLFGIGDWRFGGGSTYHFNIEMDGGGPLGSALDAEFKDAVGWIAEVDYYFHPKAYIGLQYTNIEYERTNAFGQTPAKFDASSVGLVIVGRW